MVDHGSKHFDQLKNAPFRMWEFSLTRTLKDKVAKKGSNRAKTTLNEFLNFYKFSPSIHTLSSRLELFPNELTLAVNTVAFDQSSMTSGT